MTDLKEDLISELEASKLIIADQQITIKRMEEYIFRQRKAIQDAKNNMNNAFDALGSMSSWGFL